MGTSDFLQILDLFYAFVVKLMCYPGELHRNFERVKMRYEKIVDAHDRWLRNFAFVRLNEVIRRKDQRGFENQMKLMRLLKDLGLGMASLMEKLYQWDEFGMRSAHRPPCYGGAKKRKQGYLEAEGPKRRAVTVRYIEREEDEDDVSILAAMTGRW